MLTVNIREARKQLSKLVDRAVKGEAFVIARAGKPLVKVMALDAPAARRLGFLAGEFVVPKDFDRMGDAAIAAVFGIKSRELVSKRRSVRWLRPSARA